MKKFFLSNLIFLVGLNVLIKSFWILGIDRSVQNTVGTEEYGLYYALLNFSWIFNIVLDFGITSFNNRTIAQNTSVLKKYFAKILPLRLILSVLYIAVMAVTAVVCGYHARALHILGALLLFNILSSLLSYLRSNISALLLFKTDSVLSVMDKSLMIIFCSVMLWTPYFHESFRIEYFVWAQVLSMTLTVLTAFIICLTRTGWLRLKFDRKFMLIIFKRGLPYATLTLLMSFYNRMDSIMLERMVDDNGMSSGIYASGFRLVDSVNQVSYLFSVILLPLFAKLIKDKGNIQEIIKISFHCLLLITSGFILVSLFYAPELMDLMYTEHIQESTTVFRILCFCFMPVSMVYIFGTLLTANGSLKKLNIVAVFGMIINIAVNLILIPKLQYVGSAIAAVSAQTVTSLVQAVLALKIFNIKYSGSYTMKILAFTASLVILSFIVYNLPLHWITRACTALACYVTMAFVFRLFSVSEIKNALLSFVSEKKKQ